MKEIYNEFFCIEKDGKIREKAILVRAVATVTVIVACLFAMGFTAYAHFSSSVSSDVNVIRAANFEAKIKIINEENNEVQPSHTQYGIYTFALASGNYTVMLEMGDSTASTGFCIVTIGDKTYYTQQIGADVSASDQKRNCVEFSLNVTDPVTVTVESHIGTSSYYGYDITQGNEFYIANEDPLKTISADRSDNG